MRKNFVKGFVAGALVFGTVTSFASVTYEALTATFPILINGQNWESDKPIVVINGSTYLPLKAIGDVLNVNVNWNNDLRQVEIGEMPTASQNSNTENTSVTLGQKNALAKAKSYLNYTSFSRKGLVEQLEYEGFTAEEATYGVDNCQADWNEQAAKKAESYLKYTSFSRKGLIEQLKYEGFTHEQALYGVEAVGY